MQEPFCPKAKPRVELCSREITALQLVIFSICLGAWVSGCVALGQGSQPQPGSCLPWAASTGAVTEVPLRAGITVCFCMGRWIASAYSLPTGSL